MSDPTPHVARKECWCINCNMHIGSGQVYFVDNNEGPLCDPNCEYAPMSMPDGYEFDEAGE